MLSATFSYGPIHLEPWKYFRANYPYGSNNTSNMILANFSSTNAGVNHKQWQLAIKKSENINRFQKLKLQYFSAKEVNQDIMMHYSGKL